MTAQPHMYSAVPTTSGAASAESQMIGQTTAGSEAVERRLFDRRLFKVAAILFPLFIAAGFARTYYLRGLFDVPPLPSVLVHLPVLVMTVGVVLFVTRV